VKAGRKAALASQPGRSWSASSAFDATHGIVTAGDLARMKPRSLLVNTSRAPLI
jgi:lactate dehydrogenase-like 2-hydroxyacid dehydrogenase